MDVMIAVNDPVRLLDAVLEGLDYTGLYRAYSPSGEKTQDLDDVQDNRVWHVRGDIFQTANC